MTRIFTAFGAIDAALKAALAHWRETRDTAELARALASLIDRLS